MTTYIRTAKGIEAPIITNNVTVHESLGSLSTISISFLAVDGEKHSKPTSYVRDRFVNNKPAFSLIQPFAEIVEKGQRYYLQQPEIDDSTDPATVTLTGIQIAKQLHWKYIGKLLHGKTIHYKKTEIIKTRVTEQVPYKTKEGKIKNKAKSHIETSTKKIPATKVDDKITLEKCLKFIFDKTKVHAVYQEDSEGLAKKTYSYPDGFGKGYADDLLKKLSQDFGFEYRWDNLKCIIAKKLGEKDSFYFVDKVNCQKINMEQNYSGITTRVTVYSNPIKTRKASVHKSKNQTKKFKEKSHKEKKPKYKKERKTRNDRSKYKKHYKKEVISTTIDGKKVSTKAKSTKTTHGVQYKHHLTYTSPLVERARYPVIDVKTKYYKANFTVAELKEKAKSLVHDSPSVSYTVTGTNFREFAKVRGKIAIGNQGLLMQLNGDKAQKARITAIESHPEDPETADQITFGNFRTDPISYQLRQEHEWQSLRDSYADLNDDSYDLSTNIDDILDMIDDNDSMRNNVGNWHVKNYDRLVKHKKTLNWHQKEIEALQKSISSIKAAMTAKK